MQNFCGIVAAILKMETGRNFSMLGINSGHHNLPTYQISLKSNNAQLCAILWWPCRNFSMSGIISGHHNLPTYEMSLKLDNVEFVRYCGGHFENGDWQKFFNVGTSLSTHIYNFEFLTPIFYAVFWKCRSAPLMVTYHYVKFNVSIIIHLEVININVRNFKFPIGFYSNPHPL